MSLRFADFRKKVERRIKGGEKIAILFDADADGASATALLVIYLMEKTGRYPDKLIPCFHDVDTKISGLDDYLIFVLDTAPKKFDSKNMIVIDHHMIKHKLKNGLFFNPREKDPDLYLPTSYLVYKIFNMPIEASWIAAIGIKADKAEKQCEDVLKKAYKTFPEFKEIEGRLIGLVSVCKNLSDSSGVINSLIESYNLGGPTFFGKTPSSSKLIKVSKTVY
ncbi:MAG TPA: DHH family phosphoesterase, partial [Candidatus Aenigmarchaeota archaeon]|nr:DHH family phosphoesterase [Candidatus Aenigmarchaeota archaeon]